MKKKNQITETEKKNKRNETEKCGKGKKKNDGNKSRTRFSMELTWHK